MNNVNARTLSQIGIEYYTTKDTILEAQITENVTWTRAHLNKNLNTLIGYLKPDTKYTVRFFVKSDGKKYCSDWLSFKTEIASEPLTAVSLEVTPSDDLLSLLNVDNYDEMEEKTAYYSEHIREHLTVEVTFNDGSKQAVTDYAVETWVEHSEDKPLVYGYDFKVTYGDLSDTSEINITLNPLPIYGQPDLTLPAAIITVDESAFEGIAATIVYIPDTCTSIGKWAFKDCTNLTQIRIPANCAIGTDAFSGCVNVVIFGTKGSAAENYANSHSNCTFVAE